MKKLFLLIILLPSSQLLRAQTDIVHIRNNTGCNVICGMEFFDDNNSTCAGMVLNTQITINAGTQTDLNNVVLDGIGYSPSATLTWNPGVTFPEVAAFYCRTVTNCPPGNITGPCTANPFGSLSINSYLWMRNQRH